MYRDSLISKLKDDLAAGRVVTIVGTGVSVTTCQNQEVEGYQVATWTGLLKHGVKHCRDIGAADEDEAELLTKQIEKGKHFLVSAAETITQLMIDKSPGVFRGWLKDTIGKLEVKDSAAAKALAMLPGVLVTLNYDDLLEAVTGRRAVTWLQTDAVQDVLARFDTHAILHLHGWYKEPDSVVLGLSSYNAVKDHRHTRAVLNLLAIDRTILFVGCGDTILDPNFTQLIEWGKEALSDVSPRHYLLCRKSELPDFQKKLAGAPWIQPLDYGAAYPDLAPFLRSLVPAGIQPPAANGSTTSLPALDLAAYQQAMRKRYSRLKLEQLDPTTHDIRPLTLTGMFIPVTARECSESLPRVYELPKELQIRLQQAGEMEESVVDAAAVEEFRRAYLAQSPRPIVDIVLDPALSRLVVLGDPGSGKSTLLQYLLLDWAEQAVPDLLQQPLPLLIELREYARLRQEGKTAGFLSYLHDGSGLRWHFDKAQLDGWLKQNPSLVLFDGVDEVFDPTLRREVSTSIHLFADTYPLARIVVTSRVIGYQHEAWRDEHFRHYMLQELNEREIAEFLTRWHHGAYEDAAQGETKRVLLARAIEDSASIRQLAGNPLLLTMMAILNRTQDLPRDRAELYEQCARLLLHQWKVDLAFAPDPELAKASLDFKDKRGLLQRVARVMQATKGSLAANLIDEETLERTLSEGLMDIPGLRPERAARALIEQLRGRNFMLCSTGGRSYAFVHRTFLEYFCAVDIRERFQTEQSLTLDQLKTEIFGHWGDESWHEVLCLLAGMLAPHFVAEVLAWLLEQHDLDQTYRHVFLAGRCAGEVRKRPMLGPVADEIRERLKALTRADYDFYYDPWGDEARSLTEIRTRAVSAVAAAWRDLDETRDWLTSLASSDEDWSVRQSAVREVAHGWKDRRETLEWLRACAQGGDDWAIRETAIQELGRGWQDDPETLIILKNRADSDSIGDVRLAAIQELARGWKDAPETLALLKTRAQCDEDGVVRPIAVQEVARGWKDDPMTLPWLIGRIWSDEHADVRQAAVRELARGWKHHPETLSILKELAYSQAGREVRRTAVQELARGWKEEPEILSLLKTLARSEEWDGRLTAIQELARGWKDDPGTSTLLKDRVSSDSDQDVRSSAMRELARGWKDDAETLTILKARVRSDEVPDVRRSAVQELTRGWKDDPGTLSWLIDCAISDQHADVRENAVQELGRGWKGDLKVGTILKDVAQLDKQWEVRRTAVQELARGWKADPEVYTLFKQRALCDEDISVRQRAVRELARGWKQDGETLAILKSCAQTDRHWSVRKVALQELARRWKETPDAANILKERAQSDEHQDVRQVAVQELARRWRDDPETVNILKGCAQSDDHRAVRETAVEELARGSNYGPERLSILKVRAQSDTPTVQQPAIEELARGWKKHP